MDTFETYFEAAIPDLRAKILYAFGQSETQLGFRSLWEWFELVSTPIVIDFLTTGPLHIPNSSIRDTAGKKSNYPDLKIQYDDGLYAIDVKSGEDVRDPWYDIGRIDTYEEKRINTYRAEYSLVVKWTGRPVATVLDVYIEPTYRTAGYRPTSKGVLYQPYSGKMRPKGWDYFDKGLSYWTNKDHFMQGLTASIKYRQRSFIVDWYTKMDAVLRQQTRQDLAKIDAGQVVILDNLEEGKDEAE